MVPAREPARNGLTITGNDITVKGLIISDFGGDGIEVTGNDDLIESSYIGTDSTGTKAMGNGEAGVAVIGGGTDNTIGGTTAGAGNVISGNAGDGVDDIGANSNLIAGNWIGTNADGTAALANAGDGVYVDDELVRHDRRNVARRGQPDLRQRRQRRGNQRLQRHPRPGQPDRRSTRPERSPSATPGPAC